MAAPAAAAPVALLADPALHTRIQGSVRLMLCSSPGHSDALARVVQNHTFSATESAWKVTHPAEGYQQGTAEFDNALPEAHTFLKQVWYSNHPQAFAIFMPPVTNGVSCAPQTCSAAVTLTTSYPQSRPCTLPARQSRTEGLSPFLPCSIQLRARSPSATLSQHILQPFTGFHVLYGVEALDPTTPIQLTVLKGPGSDAYVVVQGAIVTAYTPRFPAPTSTLTRTQPPTSFTPFLASKTPSQPCRRVGLLPTAPLLQQPPPQQRPLVNSVLRQVLRLTAAVPVLSSRVRVAFHLLNSVVRSCALARPLSLQCEVEGCRSSPPGSSLLPCMVFPFSKAHSSAITEPLLQRIGVPDSTIVEYPLTEGHA